MNLEEWMLKVGKEVQKHAERDDCYECKQLLKFEPFLRFLKAKSEKT